MIELTRSQDLSIVSAASEALAQYRTRESVAALIALTRHPDPSIRIRACFDVRGSGRPEADEAEERLLDDKEPNVRAMVIGSFCGRIELDKFIPRFAEMLNDPDAQVRSSAAYALGRCGDSPVAASHVAKVLLAALKKEPHGSNLERALLEALYQKSGRSEAIGLIDNNIDLVIAALKRGGPNDWFGSSSCYALEILSRSNNPEAKAALTWAAWSHPNAFIRGEGRRYLPWTPVKIAFVRLICMLIVTLVVSLVLAVILRAVAKSVQNLDVGLRSAYVTVFLPAVAIVTIGLFVSLAVGAVTHPKWASNVVWSLVFAIAFLGQSYSIRSRLRISLTRACLFSLVPFAMACLVVAIAFFATAKTFT
jgi:hypothetical protein